MLVVRFAWAASWRQGARLIWTESYMTESEMIDAMLEFYALRPERFKVDLSNGLQAIHSKALQKMIAYSLIERGDKPGFHFLTQRGYEAYKSGGFDKWLASTEKREAETHQAAIISANSTQTATRIAWITGGLALIATSISVLQYVDSQSTEKEVNELKSQLKSLSQRLPAQKTSRKENLVRVNSLPTAQMKKK